MNAVAEVIEAAPADDKPIKSVPVKVNIGLLTLAELIRKAHADANKHAQKAVTLATAAGEHLTVAKQQVQHGQWEQWVEKNCGFALRTAQAYMKLAAKMRELPQEKAQRVALLPLREALKAVAEPADDKRPPTSSGTKPKAAVKPVRVTPANGKHAVEVPAAKLRVIIQALDDEGQKGSVPGSTVAHLANLLRELLTSGDCNLSSIARIEFERAVAAEVKRRAAEVQA